MKKKTFIEKYKELAAKIGILIVVFVLVGGVIWAQTNGDINVSGDYNDYRVTEASEPVDFEAGTVGFIASPTGLTDVDVTNDLRVQGELETAATSSWGISEDGFVKRIAFPTATSTVAIAGNLAAEMTDTFLINSWGRSVCQEVIAVQTIGTDDLGIYFTVGTSTPSTTLSLHVTSTATLLSRTQFPTSTDDTADDVFIINMDKSFGTFFQLADLGTVANTMIAPTATRQWIWENGDAIGLLASTTHLLASSTPFAEQRGYVDVDCRLSTLETAD